MSVYALQAKKAVSLSIALQRIEEEKKIQKEVEENASKIKNARYPSQRKAGGMSYYQERIIELTSQKYVEKVNWTQSLDDELGKVIISMGDCVTYSVYKRMLNAGANKQGGEDRGGPIGGLSNSKRLLDLQRELRTGRSYIDRIQGLIGESTEYYLDKQGEKRRRLKNPKEIERVYKGMIDALTSDALDVSGQAQLYIIDEIWRHYRDNPGEPLNWKKPYRILKPRKSVIVWGEENLSEEDITHPEVEPIKQIFAKTRRYIQDNGSLKIDPKNPYLYLEDIIGYDDNGEEVRVYERLPKYSNLAGGVMDINGDETLYNQDRETSDRVLSILDDLQLTDAERRVVLTRLSGDINGYILSESSTAKKLGVSQVNVNRTLERVQKKCISKGYKPSQIVASDPLSFDWIPRGLTPQEIEELERELGIKADEEKLLFEYFCYNGKNGTYKQIGETLGIQAGNLKVYAHRITAKAKKAGKI